ncbi:hypothetical protein Taro_021641 [Colocasia esculenta]|uniref:protein-serine/threonine phosphatase n=1 Tax=Colocasia esculenta TaxID=4460 RepID=A0A843US09_COLES|nr:hypothetical protein [Colocasia esculenta]
MVAGAEVFHQSVTVLDAHCRCAVRDVSGAAPLSAPTPVSGQVREASESVTVEMAVAGSELDLRMSSTFSNVSIEAIKFVPNIRSGSFCDIGPRRDMEDEHIRIDDLALHLGSVFSCPKPSAFYGVFDGHGGPDAAAYVRKHVMRLFFRDAGFPQDFQADDRFLQEVVSSMRRAFLLADDALADDCTVSSSTGTTALTALVLGRRVIIELVLSCLILQLPDVSCIVYVNTVLPLLIFPLLCGLGRLLVIANVGDCRAVLCRKGEAVDMSQDHRPIRPSERSRVEECGGYVDDGYVNGMLSVTRVLGDWDLKFPRGAPSPLIAEPELMQAVLTEEDEFLIIGCDGIWDVMSSQHAVSVVRRGLQRHDDPEKCARELVMEALRLNTFDNLTVIVVCFSAEHRDSIMSQELRQKLRCCSLSTEALCSLKSWLNDDGR